MREISTIMPNHSNYAVVLVDCPVCKMRKLCVERVWRHDVLISTTQIIKIGKNLVIKWA